MGRRRLYALIRVALCACALAIAYFALSGSAYALGPGAVRTPAHYNDTSITAGDDTSNLIVGLPFSMNWNGSNYTSITVNMNGNVTFGANSSNATYTPSMAMTSAAFGYTMMAPLWADVDTGNNPGSGGWQATFSSTSTVPIVNGHKAFFVNWQNVRYYGEAAGTTVTDSFQLVIIDRSDIATGNFDFEFNYDKVGWDLGTASNTQHARAGWAVNRTGYELPGSGFNGGGAAPAVGPLADVSASSTALIWNSMCSENQLGRYRWQVRGGLPPNLPPVVTVKNRTLEANIQGGYASYNATASGDATASDPDGSIKSFTSTPSLPATLPLGSTVITWTAVDNRLATTTAQQTVVVTDTTPPTLPTLASTTPTNTWNKVSSVTVTWPASSDIATGIAGYSYAWSLNATAMPDVVIETTGSVNTSTLPDGSWYFNLRAADRNGNWTTVRSIGPFRVDTIAPSTGDTIPSGWTTASITVTLTATDPSGPVSSTAYSLNGGAVTTYTTPFLISTQGTTTVQYRSRDAAGNQEVTDTVLARIDSGAPSQPATAHANAVATNSVEITYTSSFDAVSGLAFYRIFRDGSLIATSTSTTYTATGLNSGQNYVFSVSGMDFAGNESSRSTAATVSAPASAIWMTITTPGPSQSVNLGAVDPGVTSNLASGTVVAVGGVGVSNYSLSVSALDFTNSATPSVPPTMPAASMSYATRGWATVGPTPFSTSATTVWNSVGSRYQWQQTYIFDYSINVGYNYDPGAYTTKLTFTAAQN